jgi:uncharacterized protein (TIGR02145 family)
MKIEKRLSVCQLVILALLLFFAYNCGKDETYQPAVYDGVPNIVFNPNFSYGTMTDQDGNNYKTIKIGKQTWMAENLRTTKYNDGTSILNVTGNVEWAALETGAYCNYNNTSNTDTIATYGRLYNWYAVNTGMLAPTGWHVPTDAEWTTLTTYLGGEDVAGYKLKEAGTTHWSNLNFVADNSSGYTALPSGYRNIDNGLFYFLGHNCCLWCSTAYDEVYAWSRDLGDYNLCHRFHGDKRSGYAVHCLKD